VILLLALFGAAAAYQIIALIACLRFLFLSKRASSKPPAASVLPGISVLKPVRGLDPDFAEAVRMHAEQDYPLFEILFGASDPDDPCIAEIQRVARANPNVAIRLVHSTSLAPNGKVAVLADLAREARYPLLVVNDADIRVPPDYLRRVCAPLEDPRIGLVTCLYRARGESLAARFEALGIATDFIPSVLVAPLFGVNEFGLGSTLAFRKEDLDRIGGFESIADYIADDYQLARRISLLG
jgi:ceramide glucosyltransferase